MQHITIPIPEGYELAEAKPRLVRHGEHYLCISANGTADVFIKNVGGVPAKRYILRPTWKPPEWLRDGVWIAMDQSGTWTAYTYEPQIEDSWWISETQDEVGLSSVLTNFSPPPVTDWKQSKRQIKHG